MQRYMGQYHTIYFPKDYPLKKRIETHRRNSLLQYFGGSDVYGSIEL